ncbi:MAG: hypothetical protein QNJ75_05010 [Acidimicrobiia bacterium]|nr:hypothetical protein [Acidimicrobiia bacterium]
MVTTPLPVKPGARPAAGAAGTGLGSAGTPTGTGGSVDVVVVVVGAVVLGADDVVVVVVVELAAAVVVVTEVSGAGEALSPEHALASSATPTATSDNRDMATI